MFSEFFLKPLDFTRNHLLEQDKGLDALVDVIQRQKMMGQNIGEEVDYQNGKYHSLLTLSLTFISLIWV